MSKSLTQNGKNDLTIDIDTLELEEQLRRMLIYTRKQCNLTQQQLSEKSGIRQSNISRIESGSCTPTIQTLKDLAEAMGKKVKIELV